MTEHTYTTADPTCGCEHPDADAHGVRRRSVLGGATFAAAAGALSAGPASATTRVTLDPTYTGDTLIVVFFRGGIDGLSPLAPLGDAHYAALRPSIRLTEATSIKLDGMFALHPAMTEIHSLYKAGKVALVHAVGQPNPTRSHFSDGDEMERAAHGSSSEQSGWVDRVAKAMPASSSVFNTLHLGSAAAPRAHLGDSAELALSSLNSFSLSGSTSTILPTWLEALRVLNADAPDVVRAPAEAALSSIATVDAMRAAGYTPAGGAQYPTSATGKALLDAARLIKGGMGVRTITIECTNWDMHVSLGNSMTPTGWMYRQLADLSQCLGAFAKDMGTHLNNTTLVTMSEFGRRVDENASAGLDHGWGNWTLVMGGGVNGGKVYGTWPGLAPHQIVGGALKVTTDYRSILAEILEKRCKVSSAKVLPGAPSARLGLVRQR